MTVYKRQDLPKLFKNIESTPTDQLYLVFGERFLCRQAASDLLERLLPDEKQRAGSLFMVDGDKEEPAETLNQLRTYGLFGGARVIAVMDSRLLHSRNVAKGLWGKAADAYQNNDLEAAARYLRQLVDIGDLAGGSLAELSENEWKKRFKFSRPDENLAWTGEVLAGAGETAVTAAGTDEADLYLAAFEKGIPKGNVLVLVAEEVDRRKKFYKHIAANGTVIDLSVDAGTTTAAKSSQHEVLAEIVRGVLADLGKSIDNNVLKVFLERVGFHPVAASLESEKLAIYLEERERVTVADLDEVIGRTREEAVFELSEAVSGRDLESSLLICGRLLDNGVHPLAIIGTLRNHVRKMLTIRSLQDKKNPAYSPGLSFQAFKGGYLERLKEAGEKLPKDLPGHPYAVYMMFSRAEKFGTGELKAMLDRLLRTEYDLKGSGIPGRTLLDSLFIDLFAPAGRERRKRTAS